MSANFSVRLDDELKRSAFAVIERYGMTPTQAVKMFFTEITETNSIPINLNRSDYTLSANGEKLLRESIADIENGDYEVFETYEDFCKSLEED
ncbi:MAG: type II toxin-antitoxin system RelB/DinJ family antitoxin [Gammaproteobacteria bacterium]|nr:type II toxin-antitoxin system RelB/DinJ family antitoxin [Gammaproteobacteria bacterium]